MSTFRIGLIYEVEEASKTSVSFLLHIKKTWTWRTLRKYCPKWQRGCGWQSKLLKRCPAHGFLERHGGSLQGIWSCLVGDFISQKQTCPLLMGRSFYGNGNLMMLTRSLAKNHIMKCSIPKWGPFFGNSSSGRIIRFLFSTQNGEGKVKKTSWNSGDVNLEAAAFFACKLFGGSDKEPFNSTISESKSRPDYHIKAPLKTLIGFLNVDLGNLSKTT